MPTLPDTELRIDAAPAAEEQMAASSSSPSIHTSPTRPNTVHPVSFVSVGKSFAPRGKKATNARPVLRDINLEVVPGEVLAILGTSGCGKSTLLRITAGLDTASVGEVLIDGTPVSGIDARCAFAFQEPRLLPWRSLADNVALGLPAGTPKQAGRERVAELLELVGLSEFAGHRPREISGGMAQRTSLARALARNPAVLLLDEPFGALDALTRLKMQDLLLEIHAAAPTTVLLVTHDVDEALQLADRVILLGREDRSEDGNDSSNKDGATIKQIVTVPGERPRNRASAELAQLRDELLAGLGIEPHGTSTANGADLGSGALASMPSR